MENPTLNRQQPVASVVLDHSECAQVFQRHRIDFCCQGDQSIEAAANAKKVDVDALLAELSRAITERRGERPDDPRELTTPRLVAYIVSKHHQYLRKTLPFVQTLATKVSRVHGDHNPKLRDLELAVEEISAALLPHLDEEERSLFPALLSKEPDQASITRQLESMQVEHLAVAKLLERIRAASDEFALPEWACNSYNTLFSELKQLESDVFTHVHLENHVLRPRFAAEPTSAESVKRGLTGPSLSFDLAAETQALLNTPLWERSGHTATTLVKHEDFRLVLVVLKAGRSLRQHQTDQRLSVQTLTGRVQMNLHDQTADLPAGRVLVLDKAIEHDVVALEDSAFLLSLSGVPAD